jgi:TolB-like protein/class 3 adenylate cyclase/Tfp pilus assembly protein PilF
MSEEQRRLAAIMFTDIVGYSAMMQKNEARTLKLLEEHRQFLRPIFLKYGGREVETIGDAFFVEFASALQAYRCAYEIQTLLHERNLSVPAEQPIRLRIGLHVGDVVHLGEHVHGDKVNIAARIQPLAEPEGICLSQQVYDQIQNQVEVPIVKLGRGELKNIQVPINIYKVVMPWEKRRLPWFERLRFKLRQKKGQQVIFSAKILLITVVLLLVGLYIWQSTEEKKKVAFNKYRIAVLPFINMSGDAENEYFSDGMTEELISYLSQIRGLEVIARTSVMTYKGKEKKIDEIGRELKVGTVLEGSVRKAENQVRVTAQLINVEDQGHLWSQTYDRELKRVFAIQSDIAQKVAEALKVRLLAGEKQRIEKEGTENLEAHNLYLKGLYFVNRSPKEDLEKSKEYFEQAIEKDPTYAQAYARLAFSYAYLGFLYLSPKETFPKAKVAAMKAVEIDDTLAEAHTSLALIKAWYDWDWSGAEREYKRALSLNPSSALAHWRYGMDYLSSMGRYEEATAELKRAQELDPLNLALTEALGWGFYFARQYDQQIEQFRILAEMDPDYPQSHWGLGTAYLCKGRHEQAIIEFQKLKDHMPLWALTSLGGVYAASGKRDEAQKLLGELKEKALQEKVNPVFFAWIYIALGEKDSAFEWLQKAYEERSSVLIFLKVDPVYDNLHSDPRFKELLKKMNLE